MSDNKSVTEDVKEEVTKPSVLDISTLAKLKDKRIENAITVEIPGTNSYVKLAKPNMVQVYKMTSNMTEDGANLTQVMADTLIMECSIEPKIDKDMLEQIKECEFSVYQTLVNACESLADGNIMADGMENFS